MEKVMMVLEETVGNTCISDLMGDIEVLATGGLVVRVFEDEVVDGRRSLTMSLETELKSDRGSITDFVSEVCGMYRDYKGSDVVIRSAEEVEV